MLDNYGRKALGHLPEIVVKGMTNPVIQVIKSRTGEIIYTLRIRGNSFIPKVFEDVEYSVKVGDPESGFRTLENLRMETQSKTIEVSF